MRNEAEFGNGNRDGSKANGSEKMEPAVEQQEQSGNGLVQQFSEMTEPKAGSAVQTDSGIIGSGKPVASAMESTNNALANEQKPNGSTRQASAGEFGKIKSTGVGDAFPSSAVLLQGLKV